MATDHADLASRPAAEFDSRWGIDHKRARDILVFHAVIPMTFGVVLGANQTGIAFYLPWALSVVYWVVLGLVTWQAMHLMTAAVAALTRPLNPLLTLILFLGALAGSFVMRPFIYFYTNIFGDFLLNGRTVKAMPPFRWELDFFLLHMQLWAGILLAWVAINLIFDRFLAAPRYRATHIAPRQPDASPAVVSGLVSRFGLPPGAEILALKSEDHYLRIFSNHGEKLILLRISDAIKELAGSEGARVHRSYWVAKQAVERVDSQGRNVTLHLKNGLQVPISQTYKESARLAGLVA